MNESGFLVKTDNDETTYEESCNMTLKEVGESDYYLVDKVYKGEL